MNHEGMTTTATQTCTEVFETGEEERAEKRNIVLRKIDIGDRET